uniref:Uncharacterized protein n=1 Tax=Oryza glumipatula TaxID=40148 RepID=A0A0E0BRD9_9ORYZ
MWPHAQQRPSVAMAWRGGGEGKELAAVGSGLTGGRFFADEWPDVGLGFFVRPHQKRASHLPRQHGEYPLDGMVSIGKYPQLWDVFPLNFTFAVSLS